MQPGILNLNALFHSKGLYAHSRDAYNTMMRVGLTHDCGLVESLLFHSLVPLILSLSLTPPLSESLSAYLQQQYLYPHILIQWFFLSVLPVIWLRDRRSVTLGPLLVTVLRRDWWYRLFAIQRSSD